MRLVDPCPVCQGSRLRRDCGACGGRGLVGVTGAGWALGVAVVLAIALAVAAAATALGPAPP
ncbi:MAG TPA: hypothetical protein VMZ50_12855 [Phycisphaerae bacterium]|nr:hypothetical protein [Phycisphaerae bacterium]